MIGAVGLVGSEGERSSSMLSITGQAAGLVRSRPVSAGAWPASTRWCCACCRVSRSRPSPGSSAFQSGNWSVGARALAGLKAGLRERSEDPAERELAEAHRRIGELSRRSSCSAPASSAPALWPAGGRADGRRELPGDRRGLRRAAGLRRLGHAAAPSFYAARTVSEAPTPGRRRGPRPGVDDAGLLEAIRRDLDRSPFSGAGTARSGPACAPSMASASAGTGCSASCAKALLSPHRGPQRPANDHAGRITTDAPGVMWGTDAAVIPTVEDGNIALFVVVEHWNAEVLGWHVAEKADRFAAAQALDLAIHTACGAVRADAARGLLLRHDHASAFASDPVQNQIAFLGMTPSLPSSASPRPTVWRSASSAPSRSRSWGRIFRNAEEVRAAVRAFVARSNEHWLLEKNAYRSPAQTRREWFAALASIKAAA